MELHDISYIAAREEVNSKLKGLTTFLEGVKLQSNIKTSVKKFGLTKATWLAVQDLPPAKNLFKELPSLESLDAVGVNIPIKDSELPVTEVVKTSLTEISYVLKQYLTEATYIFKDLKDKLKEVTWHFENTTDSKYNSSKHFFGLPVYVVDSQLDKIEEIFLFLSRLKLSKNKEITEVELEELETQTADAVNVKFRGNIPETFISSLWGVDKYNEYSLHDAGYTKEEMRRLLSDIKNCLDLSLGLLKYKSNIIVSKVEPVTLADTADVDITSFDESDISQEETLMEDATSNTKLICLIYWLLETTRQLTLQILSIATSMIASHYE